MPQVSKRSVAKSGTQTPTYYAGPRLTMMRVRLAARGLALATFALAHVSLVERDAATSPFFLASERDGARVM